MAVRFGAAPRPARLRRHDARRRRRVEFRPQAQVGALVAPQHQYSFANMRGSAMLGTSVLNPGSSVPLFEVVSSIRTPSDVRHQDSLGPDHRRCRHRAHHLVGGDAMDGMAIGLPQLGQPWFALWRGAPVYLPPAFFW